jgi:hypothetical protein
MTFVFKHPSKYKKEKINNQTFIYKWKHRTVWQSDTWKTDTIKAIDFADAKKKLKDKYYGFVADPNCMFGGGSYKSDIDVNFESIKIKEKENESINQNSK